jgi:hypothetical protein
LHNYVNNINGIDEGRRRRSLAASCEGERESWEETENERKKKGATTVPLRVQVDP